MLRRIAPLVVVALTSCRTAAPLPGAAGAPAPDSIETRVLLPPITDLSGGWRIGTGDAPQVRAIVLHPTCTVIPAVWLLEQKENELRAWDFPERYNQGIMRPNQHLQRTAPATGTISGADVRLSDGSYTYLLQYDSASGHLRGTRNGERIWAVRQQVVRTETCLPPPA